MAELSPDRLKNLSLPDNTQPKTQRPKLHQITNIVERIRCFSSYITIILRCQLQRVIDFLGYQNLIITSHLRFSDFNWATYDREFHQQAAASVIPEWSVMDTTLWNLARQPNSQHSRSHLYAGSSQLKKTPICLEWNDSPAPGCPHHSCHFDHICYQCINVPNIPDKYHKAILCPHKDKRSVPPTVKR